MLDMTWKILSPTILVKVVKPLKDYLNSLEEFLKASNFVWKRWASFLTVVSSTRKLTWEALVSRSSCIRGTT